MSSRGCWNQQVSTKNPIKPTSQHLWMLLYLKGNKNIIHIKILSIWLLLKLNLIKCRTTESVCKFLDSISLGTCKVKISEEDLKRIKQLTGKESARKTYNKNKGSEKKINKSQLKKAENTNLDDLLKSYPLFQIWPQVLKQILLVSFLLTETKKIIKYWQICCLTSGKTNPNRRRNAKKIEGNFHNNEERTII